MYRSIVRAGVAAARRSSIAALAIGVLAAPAAHAALIGDGAFAPADWSLGGYTNSGSGVSASQVLTGGDPGSYRLVNDSVNSVGGPVTNSIVVGVSIYESALFDPASQGALGPLNFSIESLCPTATTSCAGNGQASGFAVRQGGVTYISNVLYNTGDANNGAGWVGHTATGLLASGFSRVNVTNTTLADATQHPDFSAAGGQIYFGFFTANSTPGGGYQQASGYDNFLTNVTAYVAPTGVPEPQTWLYMLTGFAGLGGALRMRRRTLAQA